MSHSLRNAWIEIHNAEEPLPNGNGRIPCGMRGLKWIKFIVFRTVVLSHSLRNAWIEIVNDGNYKSIRGGSHSLRNAWIEIVHRLCLRRCYLGSHSLRNAWIEIMSDMNKNAADASHSLRNAWIEIGSMARCRILICVAFPAECVD